ncbi:MAG: tyrosine-type recombinase/integrase [Flavobacteriaceae bacterium]
MQLVESFLNYLSFEKKYAANTIISYENDLKEFALFIKIEYEMNTFIEVHYNIIRAWIVFLVSQNKSNRTINRKISALKSFYKFLIKTKCIKESPLQKHKSLKVPKRINIPFNQKEIEEVILLFDNSTDFNSIRNKLIVETLYATGIRRNELISIKLNDVDLKRNTIKVLGKRNKERYIPLLKIIKESIQDYLIVRKEIENNCDYLFITEKGNKLYGTLVYRVINSYFSSVSSKVKKSPHVLRHAFATHLLNEGADLNAVKELLGHASLASTQVYINSSLKELKKVYNKTHPRGLKK